MIERIPDDYANRSEQVIDDLRRLSEQFGGVKKIVKAVEVSPQFDDHRAVLFAIAMFMEQSDEDGEYDPEKPVFTAFFEGAMIGLAAARAVLKDKAFSMLPIVFEGVARQIDEAVSEGEDDQEDELRFVENLLEIADNPDVLEDYEDMLIYWEEELCPDGKFSSYVSSGFGFVMATALDVKNQLDIISIKRDINNFDQNIDQELEKLFDQE